MLLTNSMIICLLGLKNEFKIEMHQEFSLSFPYEDIVIRLAHVSTRISL